MILPIVHLNGSSLERLLEQNTSALRALRAAISALGEAAPNGRDYYLLGEGAIITATTEHLARVNALMSIERDLVEVVEHLHAQAEQRRRQRSVIDKT